MKRIQEGRDEKVKGERLEREKDGEGYGLGDRLAARKATAKTGRARVAMGSERTLKRVANDCPETGFVANVRIVADSEADLLEAIRQIEAIAFESKDSEGADEI